MTPEMSCEPLRHRALTTHILRKNIGGSPHKELDTVPYWSIIVFTKIGGLRAADGRPGHQAPDAATTGNAQPAPESGTRRAVSPGRFLRSSRSRSGQVRDVASGAGRRQVRNGCGGKVRLFAPLF